MPLPFLCLSPTFRTQNSKFPIRSSTNSSIVIMLQRFLIKRTGVKINIDHVNNDDTTTRVPPEANPTQWPTFENLSVWYGARCQDHLADLNVVVTHIQKWWRQQRQLKLQRDMPPIVGFPDLAVVPTIPTSSRSRSVREITKRLQCQVDPKLQQIFRVHEKLDGTNLGIRCDGAVFGRRFRIYQDTYQSVPLEGTLPCEEQVYNVKYELLRPSHNDCLRSCQFILYGELMVDPNKFDYTRRSMGHQYYAFGGMLVLDEPTEDLSRQLDTVLRRKGLNFHVLYKNSHRNVYRIMLNQAFKKIIYRNDIMYAPMMGNGTLRQVCYSLKDLMMQDGFEGVVLTAPVEGTFYKWKTSVEDKSGGLETLMKLSQSYPSFVLELAGIDVEFVQCLIEVATPKYQSEEDANATIPYDGSGGNLTDAQLDAAYESALTKFDSLEAYFARNEQGKIIQYLQEEISMDVMAFTRKDKKIVNKAIKSRVMAGYKQWRKAHKAGSKK